MYKIACFRDAASGRLKVDPDAIAGGKQNPSKQGSRVLLIYKTYMHTESSLDPGRCTFKTDANMRSKWITKQIQQVDQHEDCNSPPPQMGGDKDMEEDAHHAVEQGQTKLPPNGSGQHQPDTMHDYIRRATAMPIRQVPREKLIGPPLHLHHTHKGAHRTTNNRYYTPGDEEHIRIIGATRQWDKGQRHRKTELQLSLRSKRRINITREKGKGPNTHHPGNPSPTGSLGAR